MLQQQREGQEEHQKPVLKQACSRVFKLPELATGFTSDNNDPILSPQASTRTVFGTKRRSEAINSRNVLDSIIQKTAPRMGSQSSLLEAPDGVGKVVPQHMLTPKGTSMIGKKRGPLRALLDSQDRNSMLERPRNALEKQKNSPKIKGETVEGTIGQIYERRIEQIHERNKPKPKLKLFSPYKKKSNLRDDDDGIKLNQYIPYDTNQAIEALDDEKMDDLLKNEPWLSSKTSRKRWKTATFTFSRPSLNSRNNCRLSYECLTCSKGSRRTRQACWVSRTTQPSSRTTRRGSKIRGLRRRSASWQMRLRGRAPRLSPRVARSTSLTTRRAKQGSHTRDRPRNCRLRVRLARMINRRMQMLR